MAKQLNQISVNLSFNADTSKAKAQLQDLQNQLNNLVLNTKINQNSSIAGQIQSAVKSAAELNVYLQKQLGKHIVFLKISGKTYGFFIIH